MNVTRRTATIGDLDLIYHLKSHSLKPYVTANYGWNEEIQRRIHSESYDPSKVSIIQYDGVDVGYLEIDDSKQKTTLENLMIHSSFQNRGIGSMIMKELIARSTRQNKDLKLSVFKNNPRALKFYKSVGFEIIESNETHYLLLYAVVN